jgi:phosphoribosylformylglycinamidine synthase
MVGLIKDKAKIVTQYFKNTGDVILLLGKNKQDLGGSEYLKTIHGLKKGKCPAIDLKLEKSVQKTTQEAIAKGLVRSAHDCSEGGLAVALAESCISNPVKKLGAVINLTENKLRRDALLFGESQSRIILSAKPAQAKKIMQIARKNRAPVSVIGKAGGSKLSINKAIKISVQDLHIAWRKAIENYLNKD